MEIINSFIPTLSHCSMHITFLDSKVFDIYLLLCENGYCLSMPDDEQEFLFGTKEELSNKLKTYIEKYEISSIKLKGIDYRSMCVYEKL